MPEVTIVVPAYPGVGHGTHDLDICLRPIVPRKAEHMAVRLQFLVAGDVQDY